MSNIRPDGSFNPEHNIKYLPDSYANEYSQFLLDEGNLVIAMTDMAGDPKILGVPTLVKNRKGRNFLLNQRVGKLTDFSPEIYIPFLRYYLSSPAIKEYYKSKGAGGLQLNISKKDVLNAEIPITNFSEQKRIVAKLDQCFESIDKARVNVEKNLQNAKDLFQSQLNEIFSQKGDGWVEKKLSEVFIFRQGIQRDVKLQTEVKRGSQVRFLRIVDYTQGNEPPRYIDNPGKEYMMSDDDIALVRYGASTGFVCNGYEGALANNLFRVIPKDEYDISLKYLYYFLKSPSFQGVIHKAMNGAAMPAISFGLINDIPFPLTQRAEQDELASIIEDVELKCLKVITNYQQELDALDELKKSILEKAFNGEL
tara:strand:+ start:21 stop:1121 length:1101 start_codon:yes stop_codon:yes gene_type:complete